MKLLRRTFYGTVFMTIMYKLQQLIYADKDATMAFLAAFTLYFVIFTVTYGIGSVIDRYIRREL